MNSIIYFDICAIPLFLIILFVCYSRKMTKGSANKLFIVLVLLSLFSAIADLGMEIPNSAKPLSSTGLIICSISTYLYLIFRNATNLVLLLFLLELTRTTFLIRNKFIKIAFFLPYVVILAMLIQNPFTNTAFIVNAENGYVRSPLMYVFYGIASLYGIVGLIYCIYCYRYLPLNKWGSLLAIYILGHSAVIVQFFFPYLLLEMFLTAIGETLITLAIMRPEERMDMEVGLLSWSSYQTDVKNIMLSHEHVKIVVIKITNSREIRNYLGDIKYNKFIVEIADSLNLINYKHPRRIVTYFEKPGTIYIIASDDEPNIDNIKYELLEKSQSKLKKYADLGIHFKPQICLLSVPEDLSSYDDIIILGHKFQYVYKDDEKMCYARDIIKSKSFAIEAHIEEIIDKAIKNNNIEMYYQPIYDIKNNAFHAAEALVRINDPKYGIISPAVFIPAAESLGLIIPLGDIILEQVFQFISNNDITALGVEYIEINLSVAQCIESILPNKIEALEKKYNIKPSQVNLEITETTFEHISDIIVDNITKLIGMGYSFSLDDYGIGYSSVQRVNSIPFKLIKIDKSMLDEANTASGIKLLEHTIVMMQSINKQIVCEGAESIEQINMLKNMNCDYIQGFYFSKPIPSKDFINFLKKNM